MPEITLPPTPPKRWTARTKRAVLFAVASGKVTVADLLARYALWAEEFAEWQAGYAARDLGGLMATKLERR